MRILYDGLIHRLQVRGGISRYFKNLINLLPSDLTPILTSYSTRRRSYPSHPNLKTYTYPLAEARPKRLSEPLGTTFFKLATAIARFDVIHPTYYWSHTGRDLKSFGKPVVTTFHDMVHEIFAEQMDPAGLTAKVKRRAVDASDLIICISENTKKDVLERYAISDDRVKVVYHAAEIDKTMAYGSEPVPDRPYILYVGSRNSSYKNFECLLRAFAKVMSTQPHVCLCVVGGELNQRERALADELKITSAIEMYSNVDDCHLAKLYRCSVAFVYPSRYEGFGIPLLEAMACGAPVVASNASCFPEIVGDAGLLFDPHGVTDLADILLQLLDSPSERDRLIAKGYSRASLFSWEQTAEQTVQLYRML